MASKGGTSLRGRTCITIEESSRVESSRFEEKVAERFRNAARRSASRRTSDAGALTVVL